MSLPLYTSYSEETQTLIEEFLENTFGWDEDDLLDSLKYMAKRNSNYILKSMPIW